jgi:aldehyde reductase
MSEVKIPSLRLSSGYQIPLVGLGTFKTENEPDKLTNAIKEAVKCGYRHFDCAFAYQNEQVVGKALEEALKENNLKRQDIFVTTKLWNTFHSKEKALEAIDMQLKNLNLDYIDLYLVHWPMGYAVCCFK